MSAPRPPLAIVPQTGGSEALLEPFLEQLRGHVEVVVFEPPGYAERPVPAGLPSTQALADAVLDEWRARDLGRAHLLGVSLGGMVAQRVASGAPELVSRLVLASTTARGLDAVLHGELRNLALARCLLLPDEDAAACLAGGVVDDGGGASDEVAAHVEEVSRRLARPKSEMLWLAAAAAAHDAREALPSVIAPTLVLTGAEDSIIKPAVQAEMLEGLPDGRQEILAGAGHDVTLDTPAACAQAVLRFVAATAD